MMKSNNVTMNNRLTSTEILDSFGIRCLFHMTHIDNLPSILQHGLLPHGNKFQKNDISDCDVNSRRSRAEPIHKKSIHSYVPFYINPKNPMLYVRKHIQDDIVMLVMKRDLILEEGTLFTDGNASVSSTSFYDDLSEMENLDWNCINDDWWTNHIDGKRTRMAEVLVPEFVGMKNLHGIICKNTSTKEKIDALTKNKYTSLVQTRFYF